MAGRPLNRVPRRGINHKRSIENGKNNLFRYYGRRAEQERTSFREDAEVKLFDKTNYKNFLIFSIFAALSTSQRLYGIFLPLSFIIFYLLSVLSKKKILNDLPGIIFFCISFLVFLTIFWPYLWSNPVENFLLTFKQMSHHYFYEKFQIWVLGAKNITLSNTNACHDLGPIFMIILPLAFYECAICDKNRHVPLTRLFL